MKQIQLDFYKSENPSKNKKIIKSHDSKKDRVTTSFNRVVPNSVKVSAGRNTYRENIHTESLSTQNSHVQVLKKPDVSNKSTKSIDTNSSIKNNSNSKKPKKRKSFRKFIFILMPLFIIASVVGAYSWFFTPASKAFDTNPISIIVDKVTGNKSTLNSTSGRVTVLILGVDNRSDQLTNDLKQIGNTDTMMLATYDSNTSKTELLSIPRDIGLYFRNAKGTPSLHYDKINSAVAYGANSNYPGGGGQLIRDTIKDITGITVNYTVIIDMDAFVQVIDTLGGIDLNIENTFCDSGYPLSNDTGIETIKFIKGPAHMDGKTALKFARSRVHNTCYNMTPGDPIFEGTDFRRGYRQQQVIAAVQEKVSKIGFDIPKIQQLISAIGNNVITQIGDGPMTNDNKLNLQTLNAFYGLKSQIKKENQYNYVASQTACGSNALKEYNHPDGYYLVPMKPSDFSNLRSCVQFYLSNPEVLSENASIQVFNTGLGYTKANIVSQDINNNDFLTSSYGGTLNILKSVISPTPSVDLSKGNYIYANNLALVKTQTLNYLAKQYNAQIITKDSLTKKIISDSDIVLILGATN